MAAAVTVTPASGSITHDKDTVTVHASGLTTNDATAYDNTKYPTEPEIRYYFKSSASGKTTFTSAPFACAHDGTADLVPGWQFDAAGTYTVGVYLVSDDSSVATTSVVVA